MSPSSYFYNKDESLRQMLVSEIRSNYAFIFGQIIQMYKIHYPYEKGLSTRAEEVTKRVEKLYSDKRIEEYIYENYLSIMKQYPTMLAGELAKERLSAGVDRQLERLNNLKQLLDLFIGDLSMELGDLIDESIKEDKKEFLRQYFK